MDTLDIKVARGVNQYLDEEAIRVVESMPVWTLGLYEGDPVNVSFTVPINFVLQGKVANRKTLFDNT